MGLNILRTFVILSMLFLSAAVCMQYLQLCDIRYHLKTIEASLSVTKVGMEYIEDKINIGSCHLSLPKELRK